MTEESKGDSNDNKDTEEEDKQVEEVTESETIQGKTPTREEKKTELVEREVIVSKRKYQKSPSSENNKLEQVKHEVVVGEAKDPKTAHIKKTNSEPQSKFHATDEKRTEQLAGKENDGGTSKARITNQGIELGSLDPQFYDAFRKQYSLF